ncbi:T9SS type A sorting domain-containing protein [Bizionia gelidisalsuginis]|uniref:T9SS type A sorting domain-containing protein n=1 Tax=Bizionia gelidisalsuginis TaxID=291188 RepID=A0ABY3MEC1_9FLAO|nr:fibronectin type III domain-containing protein [Bizionia gelidisalsuginis]TYC17949.1 T9SS type A sorting domain-containing protein [Bizionia gelidisalsuginis]
MKKITFSLLLLICCIWQSSAQIFIEENLDSGFPTGWTQNSYFASTTAAYLCEGTGNLYNNMFSSSSNDGSLTSPNYVGISNETDTTVEFQWLARPYSSNAVDYIMYVEYSADDAATWSLLSSFAVTETTACSDYLETIPASSLPSGSDFKFRIRGEWQSGDSYFYLDNIAISQVISCPQPSALLASNLSTTTADLEWTGGTETTWNIELVDVTAGGTQTMTATDAGVTTNPYSISGLVATNDYEFYVQADCGSGELSAWVGPFAFTTLCDAIVAPYTASFEDAGALPGCWNNTSSTSKVWSFDTAPTFGNSYSDHTSGSGYFALVDGSTTVTSIDTTLESGEIDVNGLATPYLQFYVYHFIAGGTDSNKITVEVWDGAAWNEVYMDDNGDVDEWEFVGVDLSTLTITGNIKVRFIVDTATNSNYENDIAVDDVSIIEAPACPEPLSLSVSNIALDTADLSWAQGGTETDYDYALLLATDPAPTTGTAITATTFAATGLTAGTDYVFYVRAVCGTDFSPFVTKPFSTLAYGEICESAIEVTALPYNTSDDTANYGDDYTGSPGASGCGTTSSYLNGDDVVYSYTASADGTINIALSALGSTYSGAFVYTDCADIGSACAVGFGNGSSSADYNFDVAVTAGTTYYVVISTWATPQSTTYTLDITQILCPDPTALTATNITTTTADLGWTAGATETTWNIEVVDITAGDSQTMTATDAGVTANPFTVTGLVSSNDYEFYVQADCGGTDGVSEWVGPFAFSTTCEAITVFPSTTDFTNNPPTVCWSEAGSGEVVDGPSGTSSDWRGNRAYEDGDGNTVNSNAINLYFNTDREWLISPVYDLSASTDQMLKVNVAVTNYSSSSTPTTVGDTMGSDDEVQLLMTIDNGATWTNLTTWNVGNQPSVNGTEFLADLAAVSGNVQFALWASDGTVNDSEDYDFHVGEFEITDSTLSTSSFNTENNFSYYPNPVENTLSLKGIKNIQNIAVLNMLGQEVLRVAPNAINSEVDMSNLQSGAYFVKVTIENATKTIKIIKE